MKRDGASVTGVFLQKMLKLLKHLKANLLLTIIINSGGWDQESQRHINSIMLN